MDKEQPILGGAWEFATDAFVSLEQMPQELKDKIAELMDIVSLIPDADIVTIKFTNLAKHREHQNPEKFSTGEL